MDGQATAQCPNSPTSAHHWMIPPVRGTPTLPSVCKYCLKDRRFTVGTHWGFDTVTKYGDNCIVGKRRKEKV
jgi:hypothetical protein